MNEIFEYIEGYSGLYQISNLGRVKSFHSGKEKILKPVKTLDGYLRVVLYKQGKSKKCKVHRLVAEAFIENPQNLPEINHKSEIKTDNRVENLEWCTRSYNINFATRNQRVSESNTNHPNKSKQVLCVETGVVYPSASEVERQLGFSQGNISLACNGKRKTCGGYRWKYVS